MTCIAAVTHAGGVVMGGDSAAIDDRLDINAGTEPKVWQSGPLMFGACGSFRVSQLLRWHLTIPVPDPDVDPFEYLTGPLVNAMRETLTIGGALTTWQEDNTEALTESGFLIGFAGRVFELYADFGIGEAINGYAAVGCGSPYALGVLAATEGLKPRRRVRLALAAAERHSAGVRGPMTVVTL
jgi:hypothetical protein